MPTMHWQEQPRSTAEGLALKQSKVAYSWWDPNPQSPDYVLSALATDLQEWHIFQLMIWVVGVAI